MQIVIPESSDREWLKSFWQESWGGEVIISRRIRYYIDQLQALMAQEGGKNIGAITWALNPPESEIVSLDALIEDRGIGTALIGKAEEAIMAQGCTKISLITSNDNIRALAFYQKRGYRIESIFPGAIDMARRDKPSIPLMGDNGIPIHDEILLTKSLHQQLPHN